MTLTLILILILIVLPRRAGCTHTPQQPWHTLENDFVKLYMAWFQRLRDIYPKLLWMNNLALDQTPFIPVSNGRMYEGGAGLDGLYSGGKCTLAPAPAPT